MDNVSESFAGNDGSQEGSSADTRSAGSQTGNDRERLRIESGRVIFIDQFLLANQQLSLALEGQDEQAVLGRFGAFTAELAPGEYSIFRDPQDRVMIIYPATEQLSGPEGAGSLPTADEVVDAITSKDVIGSVRVETRAVTFADAALLKEHATLEQYRSLWRSGDRKGARDFLRSKGAAVRYGFNHRSDELRIARSALPGVIALRA